MIQDGILEEVAAGDRHGFHIPLILDEKPFQDGRYFFASLAQLVEPKGCRLVSSPFFKYYSILDDGNIVGGVLYRCEGKTPFITNLNAGEYYLARIYIDPAHQCRGIGKKAILLCEKEFCDATKFYVDFPRELEKNRRCYESAGFYNSGKELEVEPGLVLVAYEKTVVS